MRIATFPSKFLFLFFLFLSIFFSFSHYFNQQMFYEEFRFLPNPYEPLDISEVPIISISADSSHSHSKQEKKIGNIHSTLQKLLLDSHSFDTQKKTNLSSKFQDDDDQEIPTLISSLDVSLSLGKLINERSKLSLLIIKKYSPPPTDKSSAYLSSNWTIYTGTGGLALLYFFLFLSVKEKDVSMTKKPSASFISTQKESYQTDESYHDYISFASSSFKNVYYQSALEYISASLNFLSNIREHKVGGFFCTSIGIYSLASSIYSLSDPSKSKILFDQFIHLVDSVQENHDMEILYGQAGCIFATRFMLNHYHEFGTTEREKLLDVGNKLCKHILKVGRFYVDQLKLNITTSIKSEMSYSGPPLLWEWHDKMYLGSAHGVCGILQTLLSFDRLNPHSQLNADDQRDVKLTIDWLISLTQIGPNNNNIYSSVDQKQIFQNKNDFQRNSTAMVQKKKKNDLIQWCHGAPGLVFLLNEFLTWSEKFNISHIYILTIEWTESITKLGSLIWNKGILTKGVGLCHGVSGNGLALLDIYKVAKRLEAFEEFDKRKELKNRLSEIKVTYFHRALAFSHIVAQWEKLIYELEFMRVSDSPYSLMEGLGGGLFFMNEMINELNDREEDYLLR